MPFTRSARAERHPDPSRPNAASGAAASRNPPRRFGFRERWRLRIPSQKVLLILSRAARWRDSAKLSSSRERSTTRFRTTPVTVGQPARVEPPVPTRADPIRFPARPTSRVPRARLRRRCCLPAVPRSPRRLWDEGSLRCCGRALPSAPSPGSKRRARPSRAATSATQGEH